MNTKILPLELRLMLTVMINKVYVPYWHIYLLDCFLAVICVSCLSPEVMKLHPLLLFASCTVEVF